MDKNRFEKVLMEYGDSLLDEYESDGYFRCPCCVKGA